MEIDFCALFYFVLYTILCLWIGSDLDFNFRNLFRSKKRKGRLFEEYIVNLFNYGEHNYFKLIDWRGDKKFKNVSPESNTYPDLQYDFSHDGYSHRFAIECKYRNIYNVLKNGKLSISDYQLKNYRRFQDNNKIPVYLVIGLGVDPKSVYELYIVPLNDIKSCVIPYSYLMRYYRHPKKRFYFDREFKKLK